MSRQCRDGKSCRAHSGNTKPHSHLRCGFFRAILASVRREDTIELADELGRKRRSVLAPERHQRSGGSRVGLPRLSLSWELDFVVQVLPKLCEQTQLWRLQWGFWSRVRLPGRIGRRACQLPAVGLLAARSACTGPASIERADGDSFHSRRGDHVPRNARPTTWHVRDRRTDDQSRLLEQFRGWSRWWAMQANRVHCLRSGCYSLWSGKQLWSAARVRWGAVRGHTEAPSTGWDHHFHEGWIFDVGGTLRKLGISETPPGKPWPVTSKAASRVRGYLLPPQTW